MSKEPVDIKRTGEYYLRRALENDEKGSYFDALKLYRKAFEAGKISAEALLHASISASRMGYTGLAGRYITEAMLRNCSETDCLCAIGFCLCAQGRLQAARRIMDLLPLVPGGKIPLRRLTDYYYKCCKLAVPSPRYMTRTGTHLNINNPVSLLTELGRDNTTPVKERELLKLLNNFEDQGFVYNYLKNKSPVKPHRILLHAMGVSAARSGQKPETIIEGWQKIMDADPEDMEAAALIAWAKTNNELVNLSLYEVVFPTNRENELIDKLKALYTKIVTDNMPLTLTEKQFVFGACHNKLYTEANKTITDILCACDDEHLRKLRHILPLRSDLITGCASNAAYDPTNPYFLNYMFLRYAAMPGFKDYSVERLAWQKRFIAGLCDYLRDTAGGFVEAELAKVIRAFMDNERLRNMCMFHTDTAQASIISLYCEKLQPNIPLKRIIKDFEAPGRSVFRAMKTAKNNGR